MNSENRADKKWAPWWIYVVVIAVCNYLKSFFVGDPPAAVNAAITLALVGFLFLAITAVYRAMMGTGRQRR